jgi:hypothetical protein
MAFFWGGSHNLTIPRAEGMLGQMYDGWKIADEKETLYSRRLFGAQFSPNWDFHFGVRFQKKRLPCIASKA